MGYLWEQKKFFNEKLKISFVGIIDANQKASSVTSKPRQNALCNERTGYHRNDCS